MDNQNLLLAKGLVICVAPRSDADKAIASVVRTSEYLEKVPDNLLDTGWTNYIAFTCAEYDPISEQVRGNLLTHTELERKCKFNLKSFPYYTYSIIYFNVDLNARKTGTELTFTGNGDYTSEPQIIEYLKNTFEVGQVDISDLNVMWIDVDSAEFRHSFKQAATLASKEKDDIWMANNGVRRSGAIIHPLYAYCFAIIDTAANLGFIQTDPYIIEAVDYKDYRQQVKQISAELRESGHKNLLFKTIFTDNHGGPERSNDINARLSRYRAAVYFGNVAAEYNQVKQVKKYRDAVGIFTVKQPNGERYRIDAEFVSTVMSPEIKYDPSFNDYCIIYLPIGTTFTYNETADLIDKAIDLLNSHN